MQDVRRAPEPNLSRRAMDRARKLIDRDKRPEDLAHLLKVGRITFYRAITNWTAARPIQYLAAGHIYRLAIHHRAECLFRNLLAM